MIYNRAKFNNINEFIFNKLSKTEWWITTRYQEKAIEAGRNSYFLEFIKK